MTNNKLLDRAKELGLKPVENEPDEDLLARINAAQNTKTFDPTTAHEGECPDCGGQGIRNPATDTHVCPTCEGTGKA